MDGTFESFWFKLFFCFDLLASRRKLRWCFGFKCNWNAKPNFGILVWIDIKARNESGNAIKTRIHWAEETLVTKRDVSIDFPSHSLLAPDARQSVCFALRRKLLSKTLLCCYAKVLVKEVEKTFQYPRKN